MARISVLQANVNHCAAAQDLLIQTMAQWQTSFAVVAEPYYVRTQDNWVSDVDGAVAIIAQNCVRSPPFDKIVKGRGCVLGVLSGVAVIGVYFSPNSSLAEFEQLLNEIGALLAEVHPLPVLVAGDFNAKSSAWGSLVTNARGEMLVDWAVSVGLVLINTGTTLTCVRQQGGSVIDLSFATPSLAPRIRDWEVVVGVETLSDHRYIRFGIVSSSAATFSEVCRPAAGEGPHWRVAELDRDLAVEAAIVERWTRSFGISDADSSADQLRASLQRVCDVAMPRVRPPRPRRQVYWWRPEIAALRVACSSAHRRYTRSRGRRVRNAVLEEELLVAYRAARDSLKVAVRAAKEKAWKEWLESLDANPWGRPYKVVSGKLRPWVPPLTRTLEPHIVDSVVGTLFPSAGLWVPPTMAPVDDGSESRRDAPPVTDAELGAAVLKLRSKTGAPGTDGVPGRLITAIMPIVEEPLRAMLSECLASGRFPRIWKTGKLVLIKKSGRPAGSPSAYRPIVLLDETCKLFERVLAARLVAHLGAVGPDLSDGQFGFRCGRSTVDAIARLHAQVDEAVSRGGVLLAVSLDIANAFNTLPWATIIEALRYHRVPWYLRRIIADYFKDRAIVFPARNEVVRREVWCGVPQGSVLGPLLWNIGFDWVLRGATLSGVGIICYADDTLVTARGSDFREAKILATAAVAQVVSRIRGLGLRVALDKSEAVFFYGQRRKPPEGLNIVVSGSPIAIRSTMKYLGLVLDGQWGFGEHFRLMAPKLVSYAGALAKLLPNKGGPNSLCRRLYEGVVRSKALYGAPIWSKFLGLQSKALLRRPQRVIAQRSARAYHTVSFDAACLVASGAPWDLQAEVLADVYWRSAEARRSGARPSPDDVIRWRTSGQERLLRKWAERLENPTAGHELVAAIRPVLSAWVRRRHGAPTYCLTQLLTGHGCFGEYLCGIVGCESEPTCRHCDLGVADSARHTRAICPAWADLRACMVAVIGGDASLEAVVRSMVDSEDGWNAVATFAESVMLAKREAQRERERRGLTLPSRRPHRRGRRLLAYANTPDLRPNQPRDDGAPTCLLGPLRYGGWGGRPLLP